MMNTVKSTARTENRYDYAPWNSRLYWVAGAAWLLVILVITWDIMVTFGPR